MNISKRVEQYVALRDKIKEIKIQQKEELAPYNVMLDKLGSSCLKFLQDTGQESARTENGTVYITTRGTASLEDAEAFMRHVIGTQEWELLDRRANSTAVKAYIEENGTLPPGVRFSDIIDVGVRRS